MSKLQEALDLWRIARQEKLRVGWVHSLPSVRLLKSGEATAAISYTTGKPNKSSVSSLSSALSSYIVPAGVGSRIGYIPIVGGRVSAMPRAGLVPVSTSHTLLGVASRKRVPGLSD